MTVATSSRRSRKAGRPVYNLLETMADSMTDDVVVDWLSRRAPRPDASDADEARPAVAALMAAPSTTLPPRDYSPAITVPPHGAMPHPTEAWTSRDDPLDGGGLREEVVRSRRFA